jgi:sulfate/thiosulfate transport system permease protein
MNRTLPGFRLAMGYTLVYLAVLVIIPLSMLPIKSAGIGWASFWAEALSPRVIAAYRLSFATSLLGALLNVVFGTIVAWTLVRYSFPFKSVIDALVDLPFALPTSVAGITLVTVYAENGWIGKWLGYLGITAVFNQLAIVIALTFVGLPFVVRTVQPVLEDLEAELEEAATTLGASRVQVIAHVLGPALLPAILTGFALAFARALGEYGSVVFVSGNLPMKTEVVPLLIMAKLEQFDYAGATAVATVMLMLSFVLILGINLVQRWAARRMA